LRQGNGTSFELLRNAVENMLGNVIKFGMRTRKVCFAALATAGALGFAPGAAAQSCALCYTTASAVGSAGIRALHVGILALLIPTLLLFLGILSMVFRRAAQADH
jgi:hypothetical protein